MSYILDMNLDDIISQLEAEKKNIDKAIDALRGNRLNTKTKRRWSPAAKKAVSARMKKYWAGRRKAEKKDE